jgi:hypothetical protein
MATAKAREPHHREAYRATRARNAAGTFKRALLGSGLVAAVLAVLVLVAISPLALRQLGTLRGTNWLLLSNIGQTYGAASALLTGLALIGVAGSIVFQIRTIQVSREQSSREHHRHLVEMSLTDPLYRRCWGGSNPERHMVSNNDYYRQQVYANLIVSNWQNDYKLGGFRERSLRITFSHFFNGEVGRQFWAESRIRRLNSAESRQDRRFCRIMEEEYQKAVAARPPTITADIPPIASPDNQKLAPRDWTSRAGVTALAAIGGIAFGAFLAQRKR